MFDGDLFILFRKAIYFSISFTHITLELSPKISRDYTNESNCPQIVDRKGTACAHFSS